MPSTLSPRNMTDTSARRRRDRLLARVEQRIEEFLAAERRRWAAVEPVSVELLDCVVGMFGSGGKRMRPAFCVAGYLAAGGDPDDPVIVDVAAALELLHSFALLHDDVMDDAERRRNRPTAHVLHEELHGQRGWRGEGRRYGEAVAVLGGDLALVYAERLLADCPPEVRRIWGELCTELMVGQFLDVRSAAQFDADPERSRWIALLKSGRYTVSRPLTLGAALAGGERFLEAFEEYGLAVGEAFQLRDDLLDVFGDPDVTGKPGRLDLQQHKMTLLMSLALRDEPAIQELFTGEGRAPDPDVLHRLLIATGVRDRVETVIEERVGAAGRAIGEALTPEWAAELLSMATEAAYRTG
ncbi:polyprenyl synthetase family protein [Streptomyces sp. NPDC057963]|uniref:polyprenyl synthetase family protein n=1 Tax=Streptomyces sp. NPDC057963 TaxID=3346290 RepID=UPI0036E8F0A4